MESSEPASEQTPEISLLQRIRNTWEFSNLMQFIFIFGKAVKIDDDFTIDVRISTAIPHRSVEDIGFDARFSNYDAYTLYIRTWKLSV